MCKTKTNKKKTVQVNEQDVFWCVCVMNDVIYLWFDKYRNIECERKSNVTMNARKEYANKVELAARLVNFEVGEDRNMEEMLIR